MLRLAAFQPLPLTRSAPPSVLVPYLKPLRTPVWCVLHPLPPLVLQHGSVDYAEAANSGIGLIIAGNDTSGLGVSALLAILPLFPKVMDKLRQEQQQVGDWGEAGGSVSEGPPCYSLIVILYLDCV